MQTNYKLVFSILLAFGGLLAAALGATLQQDSPGKVKVRITWGHKSRGPSSYYIKMIPATRGVEVQNAAGYSLESGEGVKDGAWQTQAGAGDVDGVEFTLAYPKKPAQKLQNLHILWANLIADSDPDTARRLSRDPAFRVNSRKITVQMNPEGSKGFSVSVDQLLNDRGMWVPSLHVYLSAGEPPLPFADHQKQLESWKGRRILDRVHSEAEATYEQYTSKWEDMGNPSYEHPRRRAPGHIVCLTWDSAIPKFGIDRGAGVWNDYGNPDHFRFWFEFADIEKGIDQSWRGQTLTEGFPVVRTVLEKEGIRYEVEQFAYPLYGPPKERRGDIPMVLLQKVKAINLGEKPRRLPITMSHRRHLPAYPTSNVLVEKHKGAILFQESGHHRVLFSIEGIEQDLEWSGVRDYQREQKRVNATVFLNLPANASREFVVKLPSPTISPENRETLVGLRYEIARKNTLKFWSDYLARGARFRVPEKVVNDLFRANLWHALRLPRRHGGKGESIQIDLPYSNFAYSQTGIPWPVNQAVYVDYMLYDLHGYHEISREELLAMYRSNQEHNGHVSGYANWGVYTPAMLYVVAKNYLLSQDRQGLDQLLPYTLKALGWCVNQIREASHGSGPSSGLVYAPLNDGTGEGRWAFMQGYMYAGLNLFGQVLKQIGHPRAQECLETARTMRQAIGRGFGNATMSSTLVQLRDRTWIPYVPCEALTSRRLLDQWYATDVDTGAVHLLRLKALPVRGNLADYLLHDHEDNLYFKGWGMANEPVYNPQVTAYLLRDDPKAVIRAFYSYMASAFSHSALEPVEHRWTHGQYFGPPSTDGAWFEVYRHMLIHELDDNTLLLGQATPRGWLQHGEKIEVERAPTYYGKLSFTIESRADSGQILATVEMPDHSAPEALLLRLRHPREEPIKLVTINGQNWTDFDTQKEWVRIKNPDQQRYEIVVTY